MVLDGGVHTFLTQHRLFEEVERMQRTVMFSLQCRAALVLHDSEHTYIHVNPYIPLSVSD
jgi:hypothetical protein